MNRPQAGSSMLEALTATVVISVGILALALLTGGIVRGNRESDRLGAAVLAADARLEELLADVPFNLDGDLSVGAHPPDQDGETRYEALDAGGVVVAESVSASSSPHHFLRRWTVTAESSISCLRRVRMSIVRPQDGAELVSTEAYANCP